MRHFVGSIVLGIAAMAALAANTSAQSTPSAESYPSRPIRFVVPFPAGSVTDALTRVIARHLSQRRGQPVVVDNRAGAAGNIGADNVAKSAPDGYTLLMATNNHTINVSLYRKLSYDTVKDFRPVVFCASAPTILTSQPSNPYSTFPDFLTFARANPGLVTIGSGGSGSAQHLGGEQLKAMAGINLLHVPYTGAAASVTGILSGQINLSFIAMPLALPLVNAGKLRALAVTSKERSSLAPAIPTIAESGVPGFELSIWYGVMAPAGTPNEIVALLNREISAILATPDVRSHFSSQGAEIATGSPLQFQELIKEDINKWAKIVKATGARVD